MTNTTRPTGPFSVPYPTAEIIWFSLVIARQAWISSRATSGTESLRDAAVFAILDVEWEGVSASPVLGTSVDGVEKMSGPLVRLADENHPVRQVSEAEAGIRVGHAERSAGAVVAVGAWARVGPEAGGDEETGAVAAFAANDQIVIGGILLGIVTGAIGALLSIALIVAGVSILNSSTGTCIQSRTATRPQFSSASRRFPVHRRGGDPPGGSPPVALTT